MIETNLKHALQALFSAIGVIKGVKLKYACQKRKGSQKIILALDAFQENRIFNEY